MKLGTMAQVATLVRNTRLEAGLTQAQLADRMGVARDWVIRLEKGNPRLEVQLVLDALVALGLTLSATARDVVDEGDPFADVFEALP